MLHEMLHSATQKDANLKAVYKCVRNEGSLTKAEAAEKTELKLSTCARLIDELIERGLLLENGAAQSQGGRKPKKYKINPDVQYIIGIDISRTFSKVLLLNLDLRILAEQTFVMDDSSSPNILMDDFIACIGQMLETWNISSSDLLGIGISAIGPLDTEEGIIKAPLHFPAPVWENVKMKEKIQQHFPVEVMLDHGENAALMAEYRHGDAKNERNIVHITKGAGIRIGIMMDGRMLRSRGGDKAGAFGQGHMVINFDGRKCTCGSYGCMHAYSRIPVLVEDVQSALKKGNSSILQQQKEDMSDITFRDIVYAAEQKDPLVEGIVTDMAHITGIGLSNVINMLHPEKIILSGRMYRQLEGFYDQTIDVAKNRFKRLFPNLDVSFSRGKLGENAAAIGAGNLIFDDFLS
ncbi:ROK family transcriptional regulator [Salibacterium sp. K-3]